MKFNKDIIEGNENIDNLLKKWFFYKYNHSYLIYYWFLTAKSFIINIFIIVL